MVNNLNCVFDVAIIGGGIQGAGIARDAALRGLSVLLCEQSDFGNATSSNSSKLIHGGLRYLERLEMPLVYEALHERKVLLKTARPFVMPLQFTIPIYDKARRPGWVFRMGLIMYDLLAGKQPLPSHSIFTKHQTTSTFSFLKPDSLKYGLEYFDCRMDDARLVIANIQDAVIHGACCLNYTSVTNWSAKSDGLFQLTLNNNKRPQQVLSRTIVNASGPWVDQVLHYSLVNNAPTVSNAKGIHLVFETPIELSHALLFEVPMDDRIFFVLPWKKRVLVGTTDSFFSKKLDQICAEKEDIQYLWTCLRNYLTSEALSQFHLVGTMAGVRPLVFKQGKSTQDLSRDYEIFEMPKNFWNIVGGKYTVYRKISEKIVDKICVRLKKKKHCQTSISLLPGCPEEDWNEFVKIQTHACIKETGLEQYYAKHIIKNYGTLWKKVVSYGMEDPSLFQPLVTSYPLIAAEIPYAINYEYVSQVEDFLIRRTGLFFTKTGALEALDLIGSIIQAKTGVTAQQWQDQKTRYTKHFHECQSFINTAIQQCIQNP